MRKFICLLLILTIVAQPALTLADVHQLHQNGAHHFSFSDHHKSGDDLTLKKSISPFDCHHCCHCHGVAGGVAIPVSLTLDYGYGAPILTGKYAARVYPAVYEKQFRPPRV